MTLTNLVGSSVYYIRDYVSTVKLDNYKQRPPGLEGEGWEESASRKKKRRTMGTTPQAMEKGIQEGNSSQMKEGGTTPTFPGDGEKE